jgi:hypothetical protein
VPTIRTLCRTVDEVGAALLAHPPYFLPWLPPHALGLLQLLFELAVAGGVHVTRVAVRPFSKLRGLSWTLGASDMTTLLADGCCGRDKDIFTLVAGAADALLRGLVHQFLTRLGCQGEHPLLLGFLGDLGYLLAFFHNRLLLGIAGALLATLVVALGAHLVPAIRGSAVVTGTVHTHADRLLHTLHADRVGIGRDPFVRLEGKAIFGKESAGPLLLKGAAVQFLDDYNRWRRLSDSNCRSWFGSSSSSGGSGGTGRRSVFMCGRWSMPNVERTQSRLPPSSPLWQAQQE